MFKLSIWPLENLVLDVLNKQSGKFLFKSVFLLENISLQFSFKFIVETFGTLKFKEIY